MRRADQLHAALGNRACRHGLKLASDLVDDDHLGHVILHRLDHHLVLQRRLGNLHAPRTADGRMGDVAVAGDLVAGVHDHHALVLAAQARRLAQQRRLADARAPQQQDALVLGDDVLDDVDGAVDGAPDAASQPDHIALAVADGRDAMQRAFDAGPVVLAKIAHVLDHHLQVGQGDLVLAQH